MAHNNHDDNFIVTKIRKFSEFENLYTSSSIEILNDDCLREIFSYFSFIGTLTLDMVCKRWGALCLRSWEKVLSLSTKQSSWCFGNELRYFHDECISEDVFKEILKRCGQFIIFLEISWLDALICMDQLQIIAPLCPNLRNVTISTFPSAIAMKSLRDNCVNLESLDIEGMDRKLEKDLSILLSRNGKLKYFRIRSSSDDTTGEFLKYLSGEVIEELILGTDFIFISYFLILAMKRFNCLRSFAYAPSLRLEDSIMEVIGGRKTLRKLSLRHNYLSNASPSAYNHLARLVNLVELDLTYAKDMNDEALTNILNNCKLLETLGLSFCLSITNNSVANIAELTKLKTLRMESLCNVTDEPIGNFPNTLEVLICSHNNRVKDHGIIRLLERAPKLNQLTLNGCSITESIVAPAIEVTKGRRNGIVLEIDVCSTSIRASHITETLPLLKIITDSPEYGRNQDFFD